MTDALARLRTATRDQHARLDALFPHGFRHDDDYRRYLQGMQAVIASVCAADAALARIYGESLHALDADLRTLQCTAIAADSRIVMDTPHARLGMRYVIDGSSMGARVLVRDADALGWRAERGARFLAYHLRRGNTTWPRLRRRLGTTSTHDADTLMTGAMSAFAFVADVFTHAAAPPPPGTE